VLIALEDGDRRRHTAGNARWSRSYWPKAEPQESKTQDAKWATDLGSSAIRAPVNGALVAGFSGVREIGRAERTLVALAVVKINRCYRLAPMCAVRLASNGLWRQH
jgi:alkylhydroperoxidase family enzyme